MRIVKQRGLDKRKQQTVFFEAVLQICMEKRVIDLSCVTAINKIRKVVLSCVFQDIAVFRVLTSARRTSRCRLSPFSITSRECW
jgi:hypothetical protein